jgi:hypothetical protein
MKIRKADGCLWFMSNRITAAFTIGLYFGLPVVLSHSRTKGDLTGQTHEPFSSGDNT